MSASLSRPTALASRSTLVVFRAAAIIQTFTVLVGEFPIVVAPAADAKRRLATVPPDRLKGPLRPEPRACCGFAALLRMDTKYQIIGLP